MNSTQLRTAIKRFRETNELSQKDLAKKINVSATTVSFWETGKSKIGEQYFDKLASALKIPRSELGDKRRARKVAVSATSTRVASKRTKH